MDFSSRRQSSYLHLHCLFPNRDKMISQRNTFHKQFHLRRGSEIYIMNCSKLATTKKYKRSCPLVCGVYAKYMFFTDKTYFFYKDNRCTALYLFQFLTCPPHSLHGKLQHRLFSKIQTFYYIVFQ